MTDTPDLRTALEFYANRDNYENASFLIDRGDGTSDESITVLEDDGAIARAALAQSDADGLPSAVDYAWERYQKDRPASSYPALVEEAFRFAWEQAALPAQSEGEPIDRVWREFDKAGTETMIANRKLVRLEEAARAFESDLSDNCDGPLRDRLRELLQDQGTVPGTDHIGHADKKVGPGPLTPFESRTSGIFE